ncbi:hypothetical protein C8R46DRAFT_1349197 [Mycena filopes]|nr:hypothetical protein C8R46DRAFT_1349197 [Mycena filopes]
MVSQINRYLARHRFSFLPLPPIVSSALMANPPKTDLQAHLHLTAPTLFIGNVPNHVLKANISALFEAPAHMNATVSFAPKSRRNRGGLRPRVNFADVNSAEKALAILHLTPLPGVEPEAILKLFTTTNLKPLHAPDPSVAPRLIAPLPSGCTDSDLFDILRPYGPIYSVRIHPIAGGIVQFWVEAHAREAEIGLAISHPKTRIGSYDPCTLFCSNLSFGLDETVLRTHFVEFGNISAVEIFRYPKTHKSRGMGTITFTLPSEASRAMEAMHGKEIEWRALSLTFQILRREGKKTVATRRTIDGVHSSNLDNVGETENDSQKIVSVEPTTVEIAPAENAEELLSKELESLRSLYDAETKRQVALEAENKLLQEYGDTASRERDALQALYDLEKQDRVLAQANLDLSREDCETTKRERDGLLALYKAKIRSRVEAQAENLRLRGELEALTRKLEMSESRLKILQLESDRPLWEAAAKKRMEAEKAERAKDEDRRRSVGVEESARKMRELQAQEKERQRLAKEAKEKERLRREAEEKARREKEERERLQREKEERCGSAHRCVQSAIGAIRAH